MNARVGHFQYSRTQLQVGGLGKSITAQTAVKHRVGGKIRSHHLQALGPFQWEGQAQALGQAPRACPHPLATTFSPASLRHLVRHHSPWVVYTLRAKKPVYGSSKYELHKTRAVQQTVRFAIAILAGP
jgi:hypothetical protein